MVMMVRSVSYPVPFLMRPIVSLTDNPVESENAGGSLPRAVTSGKHLPNTESNKTSQINFFTVCYGLHNMKLFQFLNTMTILKQILKMQNKLENINIQKIMYRKRWELLRVVKAKMSNAASSKMLT